MVGALSAVAAGQDISLAEPGRLVYARETFALVEFGDELHVIDQNSGNINNNIDYRFDRNELKAMLGKQLNVSAIIRQIASSRKNAVGITVYYKDAAGKIVTKSARIDDTGDPAPRRYTAKLAIPADAVSAGFSLNAANGYNTTAEAFFSNLKVDITEVEPENNSTSVNLLFDPGFETRDRAVSNYLFFDEYLQNEAGCKLTGMAWQGKKALEIAPGASFALFANDQAGDGAVFSFYGRAVKADEAASLAVSMQTFEAEMHGSNTVLNLQTYALSDQYQRFQFIKEPGVKKAPSQQMNLYYIVLTNSGNTPLAVDAVQLEQGTQIAGDFNPERGSKLKVIVRQSLNVDQTFGTGRGVNRFREGKLAISGESGKFAQGGMAFAPGELVNAGTLAVKTPAGRKVPAQFDVLAVRPLEQSIIAVLVTLEPGSDREFVLYNQEQSAAAAAVAAVSGNTVTVDTGKLKMDLGGKSPLRFVPEVIDVAGKVYRGTAGEAKVIYNGPLTATVRLRGNHVNSDGETLLHFSTLLTFYSNSDTVKIGHSFENFQTDDQLYHTVKELSLRFADKTAKSTDILQRHRRFGQNEFILERDGKHPGNEVFDGKLGNSLVIEDFWQMAPRGLAVADGEIILRQWPSAGNRYLDLPLGFSSTVDFSYSPSGNLDRVAFLKQDFADMRKSGVFGDFLSQNEAEAKYPLLNAQINSVFDRLKHLTRTNFMYGMGDFGEIGNRCYYKNNETTAVKCYWMQYLRTGDVDLKQIAESQVRHLRDVDMAHFGPGTVGLHPHIAWGNISYNFHTGHFWITGLIWHYYLTGDRRSYESAVASAAVLIQKAAIKYPAGRERHRMLYHLAELYELSGGEKQILDALILQYNQGGKSDPANYYGALSHEALLKMYQVTGDKQYLERLQAEIKEFQAKNQCGEMPEDRTKAPGIAPLEEGRLFTAMETGAKMAKLQKDPALLHYLIANPEAELYYPLALTMRDHSIVLMSNYMAGLDAFGLKEPAGLPLNYHFINSLTGKMPIAGPDVPFELVLAPDAANQVELNIYRQRRFRYWQFKPQPDPVKYQVGSQQGELYANTVNEMKTFAVSSAKPVSATVNFAGDAWGGVASPREIALKSNRYFSARGSFAPIKMYYQSDAKLVIDWRWLKENNVRCGEALGVAVYDEASGRLIGSTCFTIPENYPSAGDTAAFRQTLDIPQAWQNRRLKLYLSDPKWIEWQINTQYLFDR